MVDDGQIDFSGSRDSVIIGTLESLQKIRQFFGKEHVIPIYVYVEDGLRLSRALEREKQQAVPGYAELVPAVPRRHGRFFRRTIETM